MSRFLLPTLAGLLAACGEAYAPLQMTMKGSAVGVVSLPKVFPGSVTGADKSQTLSIREATNNENPGSIPYFTAKLDQTISWDDMDWCVEAGGDTLGAEIRVSRCTGTPSQKWNWVPDEHGSNMIQLKGTKMCLDAAKQERGVNGVPLQLQACANIMTEWKFEDFDTPQRQDTAADARHILFCLIALAGIGAVGLGAFMRHSASKTPALTQAQDITDQEGGVSLTGQSLTPSVMVVNPMPSARSVQASAVRASNAQMGTSYAVTLETLDGTSQTIDCPDDKHILDIAELNGIDLPSACRSGSCGVCAGKVTSGSVDQSENDFIEPEQLEEGFAFLCMAYPRSDCTILTHQEEEAMDVI